MSIFRRWFGQNQQKFPVATGSAAPLAPTPQVEGSNSDTMQFEKFTPEQKEALSQILQMGLAGVQDTGAGFGPIAQKARTEFREQTIPTISERFTAMGGQRSGAFPQILGQAGAGLEEGLASLESQYNLQRQGQLQNLLGLGLGSQFDTLYRGQQQQPGFLQNLGGPLGRSLGSLLPLLLSGGLGGGVGGNILSSLGR